MIRWINSYIGTAAWNNIAHDSNVSILDVRNLVDKDGNDTSEIESKINEGLEIIKTSGKLVVCCDYGMSRSNSIAAGIICKKENIEFADAVRFVSEKTGEKEIKISMINAVKQAVGKKSETATNNGKILITGSSGFIGSNLRKVIEANGETDNYYFLASNEVDLTSDVIKLNLICQEQNVKTIIHLASPRVYTTSASFGQTIVMLKNVLDVCVQNEIKLIYPSSWEVYSGYKTSGLLVNESVKMNPGGTYGQSKMLCENLIEHFVDELSLKRIVLRFSPIYGIGADKPKCIWNFAEKALAGQEINTHLYLNGLPTIDLLHIEDACRAIINALQFSGTDTFNIGSGKVITTHKLAEDIINLSKSPSKVIHTKLNLTTNNINLDINKAKKILKWAPVNKLNSGLMEIITSL